AIRDLTETKGRQRTEGEEDIDPELRCEITGKFLKNYMRKVEMCRYWGVDSGKYQRRIQTGTQKTLYQGT
ncbi:hypothetical protein IGI04_035500, partial [Brassica rapa subsp. trilocularis]